MQNCLETDSKLQKPRYIYIYVREQTHTNGTTRLRTTRPSYEGLELASWTGSWVLQGWQISNPRWWSCLVYAVFWSPGEREKYDFFMFFFWWGGGCYISRKKDCLEDYSCSLQCFLIIQVYQTKLSRSPNEACLCWANGVIYTSIPFALEDSTFAHKWTLKNWWFRWRNCPFHFEIFVGDGVLIYGLLWGVVIHHILQQVMVVTTSSWSPSGPRTGSAISVTLQREKRMMPKRMNSICQQGVLWLQVSWELFTCGRRRCQAFCETIEQKQ